MIKKTVAILLAVILSLSLFSCSDELPIFSHCELTIDLSDSFYEIENENFDVTYTDVVAGCEGLLKEIME